MLDSLCILGNSHCAVYSASSSALQTNLRNSSEIHQQTKLQKTKWGQDSTS